jgi:hypothetical protein
MPACSLGSGSTIKLQSLICPLSVPRGLCCCALTSFWRVLVLPKQLHSTLLSKRCATTVLRSAQNIPIVEYHCKVTDIEANVFLMVTGETIVPQRFKMRNLDIREHPSVKRKFNYFRKKGLFLACKRSCMQHCMQQRILPLIPHKSKSR